MRMNVIVDELVEEFLKRSTHASPENVLSPHEILMERSSRGTSSNIRKGPSTHHTIPLRQATSTNRTRGNELFH
ncbi:hypothetical protein CDAR_72781 [Caerostris darwini]|uniref:Uncharacterized protein n=1 Tax=Caerostris darwini TaxID=1538125 RepID=A0AAV4MKM6_9ARAC|nr:hypothetical protein CDAR_72781 [Caerostris darwini]